MQKVRIIYGSSGGNTEFSCERVAQKLTELGFFVELVQAKRASKADFALSPDLKLLILASPTYGHGLLEQYMEILLGSCQDLDLTGQKAAIIGLGDIKYDADYFIESAKLLKEFLVKTGADVVGFPLMIAKSPFIHTAAIDKWAVALTKLL
jgi:flavodoxin